MKGDICHTAFRPIGLLHIHTHRNLRAMDADCVDRIRKFK